MDNWFGLEKAVSVRCRLRNIQEQVYFRVEEKDGFYYSKESWFNGCEQCSDCPECETCRAESYQTLLSGSC